MLINNRATHCDVRRSYFLIWRSAKFGQISGRLVLHSWINNHIVGWARVRAIISRAGRSIGCRIQKPTTAQNLSHANLSHPSFPRAHGIRHEKFVFSCWKNIKECGHIEEKKGHHQWNSTNEGLKHGQTSRQTCWHVKVSSKVSTCGVPQLIIHQYGR